MTYEKRGPGDWGRPSQPPLLSGPVPAYGETKADAYTKLVRSGRDLKQNERVRLAIAYLEPTTRDQLYSFFNPPAGSMGPGFNPMKSTSVSRAVNSLIWAGHVRVIGKRAGRFGSDVEVIALGQDERIKRRKGRFLEQPELFPRGRSPMALMVRRLRAGQTDSFILGLILGAVVGASLLALIFVVVSVLLR